MVRVEFRLSMPGVRSWNGRWSGEDKNYVINKTLTNKMAAKLGLEDKTSASWFHRWSDGWCALVTATVLPSGKKFSKSDGFCGYDWMVNNIFCYGATEKP